MKIASALVLSILIGAIHASAQERPARRITIPVLITAVAFSADGNTVTAWDPAGWSTWDAGSGRQTGREPALAKACGRVATLPRTEDGRTIGVSCEGRLFMFDAASTASLGEWKFAEKEVPILFTAAPDGSLAAAVIAGATGTLQIADRSSGKPIAVLTTPEEIEHAAFAPGAMAIATGGIGGVRVWTVPDGREAAFVKGGATLAFSPDGGTLAVARPGGAALVDPASGEVRRELDGPSTILRYSGDGRRLAGMNNQQVVVWDTASGRQLLVLKSDQFVAVALNPDGLSLVTVSRELRGQATGSTIAIWRVPPPE